MTQYPVPWDLVFGLTRHIARGTHEDIDAFTAEIVRRMDPPPSIEGLERLPDDPRFVLIANHYQRKGLWILHTAAVLTQAIRMRYGPGDPPVRWVVTANWPRLWRLPNPGDWLLPRVAHALGCYPVAFASTNPAYTAGTLRRILKDARTLERPLGIFPEGVAGTAGRLTEPLPGVDRLLEKIGLGVVPAGIWEADDRLHVRFGSLAPARDVMRHVADLLSAAGPAAD